MRKLASRQLCVVRHSVQCPKLYLKKINAFHLNYQTHAHINQKLFCLFSRKRTLQDLFMALKKKNEINLVSLSTLCMGDF
jgi:hypothetical protein